MTEREGNDGHRDPTPGEAAAVATPRADRIPVAAIGASAGGLEALTALIARLRADGMAFVILQHLAPARDSLLTEILKREAAIPVVTASDGVAIARGTIYVAPPGVDLTVEDGALHLRPPLDDLPRRSIDRLFRSLASDLGELAIGVVLSGVGSDGTLGLRAIKAAGGITLAQEPTTAGQAGMPQSAVDAGCIDFCLAASEIGDELMRLAAHPYVARLPRGLAERARGELLARLRDAFGVDFSTYKHGTIERRIERRMALQNTDRIDDYLSFVADTPGELAALYDDLLIGVTGFFRDREPFELLKTVVFPRLLEGRTADLPIRIWVPGCSTGEEAYSVAICALEALDGRPAAPRIQIFATDIDDDALAFARHASYAKHLALDLPPDRLQRFFSQADNSYQVSRQVRDLVVFAHHNLGKDPPFSRLDLVTCRNVLIYLQPAQQQRVLRSIHYGLKPDAFLLLGSSESIGDCADLFALVDRKQKLYSKKNIASAAVFEFASGARHLADDAAGRAGERVHARPAPISVMQLADRKVLDRFGPPGVLLDHKLDVVQFRGNTGPFLAPLPGEATLQVFKLIRPELLIELRAAVAEAVRGGIPVAGDPVRLHGDGAPVVVLEVIPIPDAADHPTSLLVMFRDAAAAPPPLPARSADAPPTESRVRDLERELLVTREYLQTSVQELQAANEELQSSNEELQSSNEELQSSNEELQTSKEELQSTNEELSTVNEELQNRMAELHASTDDLGNLLSLVSVAVVIVGLDLRIRRCSAAAGRLLELVASDVGRPLSYLASALGAPQLEVVVGETIQSLQERVLRVRCSDAQWYTLRVSPFRAADHAIRGALLELVKAPPGRTLGELPEVQALAGKVLSMLPDVLVLLDDQLRVVWANRALFDTLQVGAEILGRPLDDLWHGARGDGALWAALEEAVAGRRELDGLRVERPFGRLGQPAMRFSTRCLPAEHDRSGLTLVTIKPEAAP
jgi:two-component system, chemotaxis family, CheB/CheR fusion protein